MFQGEISIFHSEKPLQLLRFSATAALCPELCPGGVTQRLELRWPAQATAVEVEPGANNDLWKYLAYKYVYIYYIIKYIYIYVYIYTYR